MIEGTKCYLCNQLAWEPHHETNRGMGGRTDPAILEATIPVCRKCHEKLTSGEWLLDRHDGALWVSDRTGTLVLRRYDAVDTEDFNAGRLLHYLSMFISYYEASKEFLKYLDNEQLAQAVHYVRETSPILKLFLDAALEEAIARFPNGRAFQQDIARQLGFRPRT